MKNLHIVGIESFGEALARAEATILACAREMLHDPEFMERAPDRVRHIIAERERMRRLINHRFGSDVLHAYASAGNFLLIRVFDKAAFEKLTADLSHNDIKVLNTASTPLLENTFRVSIGMLHENETFFFHLRTSIEQALPSVQVKETVFHLRAIKLPKPVRLPVTVIPAREAFNMA